VDVYLPDGHAVEGVPATDEVNVLDRRVATLADGRPLLRLLVDADQTEPLLDALQAQLPVDGDPGARIVVTSVEATLPRPEPTEADEPPDAAADQDETGDASENASAGRISREELYQDVRDAVQVTGVHYAFVALSVLVAAAGMLRDDTAVVIGAMVIAPLIGPNLALALGTTLADADLLRRAVRVNVVGLALGLLLAVGMGAVLPVDPSTPEIAARTRVGLPDIALALAAGAAGALARTRGLSAALIGVMVAVALVPPLVAGGLFVGAGDWARAGRAGLLLTTNVVCVNLAAVATFLVQGIRPTTWYEAQQARRSTRWALALWTAALLLLVAAILLANGWPVG
jgi:uncharacterized hydrophobic protein (TIGR00341 family)